MPCFPGYCQVFIGQLKPNPHLDKAVAPPSSTIRKGGAVHESFQQTFIENLLCAATVLSTSGVVKKTQPFPFQKGSEDPEPECSGWMSACSETT